MNKRLLIDMFYVTTKKNSKKRTWYYQHEGEKPQPIIKEGNFWYYNPPVKTGSLSGSVGCDTLAGAKGDLLYSGAKVWSELK